MLDPLTYIALFGGFVLLFLGGEGLVRGAVSLARRLHVSPLLIGATVVAFGTSAPELVVSLDAALKGAMGIAFGNIVGSNIANLLLILGVAAMIWAVKVDRRALLRDGIALALSTALIIVFARFDRVERWEGVVMFLLLGGLIVFSYWQERRRASAAAVLHTKEAEELHIVPQPIWLATLSVAGGLAAVVGGAHLLVDAAVTIAHALGMSDAVIGLTIVAVGSSLPELATTVVAAYRRHTDVALGNVLGSSVFNILGILGLVAAVRPIAVPAEIIRFDLWFLLGTTIVVLLPVFAGWRVNRPVGALFVLGYAAFVAVQFVASAKP